MIISQLAFMFLIFILIIIVIAAVKEKNPILSGIAVIFSWFVYITAPNVQIYEYVPDAGGVMLMSYKYSSGAGGFVFQNCGFDFFGWLGFAMAIVMFVHLIITYILGGGGE